jgi:DNA-binding response OmpR family regulator
MYILLVAPGNVDPAASLLSALQAQGHQLGLAHTAETTVDCALHTWPDLIVFNAASGNLDVAHFRQLLADASWRTPQLIVGYQEPFNALSGPEVVVVSPDEAGQLKQGLNTIAQTRPGRFLRLPGLIIDFQERKIRRAAQNFSLTPKELKLLALLTDHMDQVMSRKAIMQAVWETDYMGDTRTLDVHIRWLREKLEENPGHPTRLITVRGVGYSFLREMTTG